MYSSMTATIALITLALLAWALGDDTHGNNLRTIYQFPNGTWIENIAVRKSGTLLVTLVNTPELWSINPFPSSCETTAQLVHHFENETMAHGITELTEDVFVVMTNNNVYNVDFRDASEAPSISMIANIPGGVLNGIATLDAAAGIVLIADSRLGLVWRLDTNTGDYEVALQDSTMTALPGRRSLIGINGVKVLNDYVYYNNCPGELFCRVRIDHDSARAVGPYTILAEGVLADDFAISSNGVGYLAGLDHNVITEVWPDGTVQDIVGGLNSSLLTGPTAAAFGRTTWDEHVLYIVTSGGTAAPVNGTYTEGGRVMALHV